MKNSIVSLAVLLSTASSVSAAPPVQDVNIVNQPVRVVGKVFATIKEPLTVEVANSPAGPLNVIVDPSSRAGLTHAWQPVEQHVQLEVTAYPIATSGIMDAT